MDNWEIARPSGVCAVSGRPLEEGEEYHVVLLEDGAMFRRLDFSLEHWDGPPEGAFCHFKSRIPARKPQKRLFVDDDLLINFFLRLADETTASRLQFRFVLALILMRKRLLRYERTVPDGDAEHWMMRLARDRSEHRVINPHLTDDQIEGVSRQLGVILHGDMGDFDEECDEHETGAAPETIDEA
jgi:hypothetical protein